VLAHPQADVAAITTVLGNVPLEQATYNAGVVLNVADAPTIPIYKGCAHPLTQGHAHDAMDIHGNDGLGGMSQTYPTRPVENEHAALGSCISRLLVNQNGGLRRKSG